MDGVLNVDDVLPVVVCRSVPPEAAVYHRKVPEEVVLASSATEPGPQIDAPVVVGAAGATPEFTVAVT